MVIALNHEPLFFRSFVRGPKKGEVFPLAGIWFQNRPAAYVQTRGGPGRDALALPSK
jgi:hypothetical protein